MPCKCSDSTTCHDPDSHEDPNPPIYCRDCGEVEVSDDGERCAECLTEYADWAADPTPSYYPDTREEDRGER
jgi:hypothetical protein